MSAIRFFKHMISFILIATFVLATVDTHWFVYPSLSRSLLMEVGMLFLALLILLHTLTDKSLLINKYDTFILAWIGYIVIHALLVNPHETYRTMYLCCSLLFLVSLTIGIRKGLVERATVENCILMAAIIHLIYIAGQFCEIVGSGNNYFSVTGSNENPTVTALYLTVCLPLIASKIKKGTYRIFFILFFIAVFSAIIYLRCRTAYIGLLAEITVYAVTYKKAILLKTTKYIKHKFILVIAVSTIAVFLISKLYMMKQDSADGRLLIWKISSMMIAERPFGYGYGLFEKNYNLKQAEYFKLDEYSNTEKRNANFIYMAYNDYLEHGIEGGIIGMMFLGFFYSITIHKALCNKRKEDTAVIIAFSVMSLTNFVYSSILPWLALMCYVAFCNSAIISKTEKVNNKTFSTIATFILLVFTIMSIYKNVVITRAQHQLYHIEAIRRTEKTINDNFYADIEQKISTSEAFWKSRASNYVTNKEFKNAIAAIHKARSYSSSPQLLYREKQCHMLLGNTDCATTILTTLSYMLPRDLKLKHELMLFHDIHGNSSLSLHYANDILSTEIKKHSSDTKTIINHALMFKKKYEK